MSKSAYPFETRFMATNSTLGLSSLTSPLNSDGRSEDMCQRRNNLYSVSSYDEFLHRRQTMVPCVSKYPGNPHKANANIHQQTFPHEHCFSSHSSLSPFGNKREATKNLGELYCASKRYYNGMEKAPKNSFSENGFNVLEPNYSVSDKETVRRYLGAQTVKKPPPLVKTASPGTPRSAREDFTISQGLRYRGAPPLVSESNGQNLEQLLCPSTNYNDVRYTVTTKQGKQRRYSTSALSQQNSAMQSAQLLRRAASYGCEQQQRDNQNHVQGYESAFHFPEGETVYAPEHSFHKNNKWHHTTRFRQPPFHCEESERAAQITLNGSLTEGVDFQSPEYENNNLHFRRLTSSSNSHSSSQNQRNLANSSSWNVGIKEKRRLSQNHFVNEQQRTSKGHQNESFSSQTPNNLQEDREVYRVEQGCDTESKLKESQDVSTSNHRAIVKSKFSLTGAPPPLKRVKDRALSNASDHSCPNPEQCNKAKSPLLIKSRPRAYSIGIEPPPLRPITENDQSNSITESHISENNQESNGPVSDVPNKENADHVIPDKCGGFAYDHNSLPKIVAVHSFISGDENVLKLIGQQEVTQSSVAVVMGDDEKTVTKEIQKSNHQEEQVQPQISGCPTNNDNNDDNVDDDEVVVTKVTCKGHVLHARQSYSLHGTVKSDSMCQTVSVPLSDHKTDKEVFNHEIATDAIYPSCFVHDTNRTAATSSQISPSVQSTASSVSSGFGSNSLLNVVRDHCDLPSSTPKFPITNATGFYESGEQRSVKQSLYVSSTQPTKVDSCVQAISPRYASTKSVAANTVVSHACAAYTHAHAAKNNIASHSNQTLIVRQNKQRLYPELSLHNCSKGRNDKLDNNTENANKLSSERVSEESIESPKVLKKRPSTKELCKKINNTRERMINEKIPWKKKVLLRLQMVLLKRLRKAETESGEKATLDVDEISAECFEMLRLKTFQQNDESKKKGAKGLKKEAHKPNKQKKCSEKDQNKKELQEESGYLNKTSSLSNVATPVGESHELSASPDRNAIAVKSKLSPRHSKIKRAKSYTLELSGHPAHVSRGKQLHRQVSSPEISHDIEATRPQSSSLSLGETKSKIKRAKLYSVENSAKPRCEASCSENSRKWKKLNSGTLPSHDKATKPKTVTSKNISPTKASEINERKISFSKCNGLNEPITKKETEATESKETNSLKCFHRVPKGLQNVFKSSFQPKSDLQRDNAKTISSWGGAIKPHCTGTSSRHSLQGESH